MNKKIIIEIHNPHINSEKKFLAALEVLEKATKINLEIEHDHEKSETSPFRCVEDLKRENYIMISEKLGEVFSLITTKWFKTTLKKADSDTLRLNGNIYINPKTGKYLTKGEWKLIQKELTRIFKDIFGNTDDMLIKRAIALGKVIQSMERYDRLDTELKDIDLASDIKDVSYDKMYENILNFADMHTGELIQDITNRSRKGVIEVIMQGYQEGLNSKDLEDRLFDKFATLNRDWRRIAETETATNFNNGYLIAELKENNNEPVFMQGISGAGACSFCQENINGKIVVLLSKPPIGSDQVEIEGEMYTAIWPGKNNFGRKKNQWWVSAGTQHPHCACSWVNLGDINDNYLIKLKNATKI